ncbi:MAG: COG1361 S-layer family protein [Candidatus Woesearchaeota archaeon]
MKKMIVVYVLVLVFIGILSIFAKAETGDSKIIITSLVNQDPDPATSGDIVEVRIGVENRGGVAAENLMLEFVPEYPFIAVTGEDNVKKVGTLKSYQDGADMKIVKFKVRVDRDATAGEYELKIKEYEEGKSDISAMRSINIEIKSKESAEVIHIDKTTLVPGMQTSLKFTVNNVGNAPLRDLTFSWINDDKIILPVGSDNTKYIKYVDIGEGAELEYQVVADSNAEAGLYQLDLLLIYDDPASGTEKEINTIAGVYVGGGTDFDIAFSESSTGSTSFTIANVGSNPAFSVSVIIPQQDGWMVSGSNSMIIGNLNTGDYTVASFSLQSAQARPTNTEQQSDMTQEELLAQRRSMQAQTPLKIQIAYTDTMGKRELVEKEVSINPQAMVAATADSGAQTSQAIGTSFGGRRVQQQSFFSKYKWYILVLVVLVVFGSAYWKYRKEKLIDSNFKFKDVFKIKTIFKKKSKSR